MSVFIPQFGPFERPLRIHELGSPSAKPGGPKIKGPTPAPKPKRRPPTPTTPSGAFVPCYVGIDGFTFPHTVNQTHMAVTLSPAAIAAGYTIVADYRDEGNFGGAYESHEAVVVKVPRLVSGGFAFAVTLAGTKYVDPTAPPVTNFCGNFHFTDNYFRMSPCGLVGTEVKPCIGHTMTWSVPPDPCSGSPSTGTETYAYAVANDPLPPNTVTDNSYSCFYDTITGCLVNTNTPCGTPSGRTVTDGYQLNMRVWPQLGHVVRSSGTWASDFHDIDALVSPDPALYPGVDPDFGGSQSFLWRLALGDNLSDQSIQMGLISQPYTKFRITQILMLYPSSSANKVYDGDFRLMGSPYVGTPSVNAAWDSFFTGINLKWGAQPFLLSYDPGP